VYGICMCPMARMYCTRYQAILDDLRSRGPPREEDQSIGAGIMRLVVGVAWPLFCIPTLEQGLLCLAPRSSHHRCFSGHAQLCKQAVCGLV
jgi:hypothetical protein